MSRDSTFKDNQARRLLQGFGQDTTFKRDLVGVCMPFDGEWWDQVFGVIREVCEELGLNASRVDHYVGAGIVFLDIVRLIEDAEFLIFDLSEARPNVYYELGYAHGVGNEDLDVLLVAAKGTALHYDVAGLRVQMYDSLEHLRNLLSRSLQAMMERTRAD